MTYLPRDTQTYRARLQVERDELRTVGADVLQSLVLQLQRKRTESS